MGENTDPINTDPMGYNQIHQWILRSFWGGAGDGACPEARLTEYDAAISTERLPAASVAARYSR